MKSLMLTFSFALAALLSLSAQGNIPQPTHEVDKYTPNPLSLPQPEYEYFYYYNGNGDLYEYKSNRWDGANWVLNSRVYYTLNANGDPTQILYRRWNVDSSQLLDSYRTTLEYQPNGLLVSTKRERWYPNEGEWKQDYLRTTMYFSNDKIQEDTRQYYSEGIQTHGNKYIYQYDTLYRESQFVYQTWNQGIWENYSREDFSYPGADAYNYQAFSRYWDAASSIWEAVNYRATQTGNALQTIKVGEHNFGGNWVLLDRATFAYTIDGQTLATMFENWNTTASNWRMNSKTEYTYNADKSIHQKNVFVRDVPTDSVFLKIIEDYDYGSYPVSTNTPSSQAKLRISPNPASDYLQIALEGKDISNLSLLDIHGKVVASSTTASNTAQLSLIGQPAGNYFLRVEQNGSVQVLPVVKR